MVSQTQKKKNPGAYFKELLKDKQNILRNVSAKHYKTDYQPNYTQFVWNVWMVTNTIC